MAGNLHLTPVAARLLIYALLAAFSAWMIFLDAGMIVDDRKFTEDSFTEWAQIAFILQIVAIFFFVGKRHVPFRPITWLLGGGFTAMLVRELDGYLDAIYHGAWLPIALLVLAATLVVTVRQRHQLIDSARLFAATPAFGFFAAGCLGIFVFSRLFGYKGIWLAIFQVDRLDPHSPSRWVKNAVEEGSELFGYCLVFCATIELLSHLRRKLADN